jgi:hypothetical protein
MTVKIRGRSVPARQPVSATRKQRLVELRDRSAARAGVLKRACSIEQDKVEAQRILSEYERATRIYLFAASALREIRKHESKG